MKMRARVRVRVRVRVTTEGVDADPSSPYSYIPRYYGGVPVLRVRVRVSARVWMRVIVGTLI